MDKTEERWGRLVGRYRVLYVVCVLCVLYTVCCVLLRAVRAE